MTVGILTEKLSAAKAFGKALGGTSGTFSGESYAITHARGHLYEFVDPSKMVDASLTEKYKKWDLVNLPWNPDDMDWKLEPIKDTGSVRQDVKKTLGACDEIVVACDVDPTGEGDAIAIRALLELGLGSGKKFSRMYFTDESSTSLQKAFTDRKPIASLADHPAFRMADFRSQFDLLSMQWTRIATNMARQSGKDLVLRNGRLKSAMVSLVGDQLKAYNDYVKKPFFQNRFRDDHSVVYTNPEEPTFDKADQVPQEYRASEVVLDSKTDKTTAPPKLLDLAGLSTVLAKTGLKPAQVLKTYQSLYEAQIVSYPRTEDRTITPEQFKELAPLVDRIAGVVNVDTSLLTHREARKTHVKPTGAHGANRPGPTVPSSLSDLVKYGPGAAEIYETLAKNYLAMLADDYRYEQQKGHVKDYPDFLGSANVPQSAGWRAVFDANAGDADSGDEEENSQGLGSTADPFVFEGANKRPPHPSMKWLMTQLEKRDVGTGATRTSTYAEVTNEKTKYPLLIDKRGKLTLADAGDMNWRLLPGTHIGNLALTEKVYADMKAVAEGTLQPEASLGVVADWVREDIETMTKNADAMRSELGLEKRAATARVDGVWQTAPGGPRTVAFKKVWGTHEFTDDETARLLAGEQIEFSATSKAGNPYVAKGSLADGTFKGRAYVGFQLYVPDRPEGWCQRPFTEDEKAALEAGETLELKGFISAKTKNTFTAKVSWDAKAKKVVPHFDDKKKGSGSRAKSGGRGKVGAKR